MESVVQKKYNTCFDFLKGIACIFVVLMHCEFPGKLGTLVQCISRFCVPFFFAISGYYCYYSEKSKISKTFLKLKRIVIMTITASAFYFLFALVECWLGMDVPLAINKRELLVWAVFNQPVVIAGQLWFLFALIYVYVMYICVQKFKLYKLAYISIPILIITYIFMAQGLHLAGRDVANYYYRNFLIEGFCFFMLGNWLHKNENKLKADNKIIVTVIVLSTIMCVIERMLLGRDFGVNVSTFIQVIALFIYGINNSEKHRGKLQIIGKRYSMFVYILHPFVWHTLEIVYEKIGIAENIAAMYLMPIIVVILSLLLSWVCYYSNQMIKENIIVKKVKKYE